MKRIIFLLLIINISFANAMSKKVTKESRDDWEYNATVATMDSSRGRMMMTPLSAPKMNMSYSKKKIGMSVGGAKDTNNFSENIERGYLPKLDSITYEGQFYNHYFDTGLNGKECKALFCPSYTLAKNKNLFSQEDELFLSVGLNSGIDEKEFKRKKLNLVVVLDISGSMGSSFDSYFYDKLGNKISNKEDSKKKKMTIATESIVAMLSHLKSDDRVGVVLFDHNAYRAKPLALVANTDREAIRNHILELSERGGTNWSAGYKEGVKLFDTIDLNDSKYENRVVFLTDAMPNRGELSKGKLFGLAKNSAEKGIHTTFVGVGVDFNNDLVEYVSKTKGANYFSVHSSKEFKKLLDTEFDYMVTPLVYDLELKLNSKNYTIEAVYGSPDANMATGEIMRVNTLFPSANNGEETKGGVILLKLKRMSGHIDDTMRLEVSYKDVYGKSFSSEETIKVANATEPKDTNSGVKKAILVSNYVTVMKNWLIDTRAGCNDKVKWINEEPNVLMKRCLIYPPMHPDYQNVATWERKSCALKVSDGYGKLLNIFRTEYKRGMKELDDETLNRELKILDLLLEQSQTTEPNQKKDDWQFKN